MPNRRKIPIVKIKAVCYNIMKYYWRYRLLYRIADVLVECEGCGERFLRQAVPYLHTGDNVAAVVLTEVGLRDARGGLCLGNGKFYVGLCRLIKYF